MKRVWLFLFGVSLLSCSTEVQEVSKPLYFQVQKFSSEKHITSSSSINSVGKVVTVWISLFKNSFLVEKFVENKTEFKSYFDRKSWVNADNIVFNKNGDFSFSLYDRAGQQFQDSSLVVCSEGKLMFFTLRDHRIKTKNNPFKLSMDSLQLQPTYFLSGAMNDSLVLLPLSCTLLQDYFNSSNPYKTHVYCVNFKSNTHSILDQMLDQELTKEFYPFQNLFPMVSFGLKGEILVSNYINGNIWVYSQPNKSPRIIQGKNPLFGVVKGLEKNEFNSDYQHQQQDEQQGGYSRLVADFHHDKYYRVLRYPSEYGFKNNSYQVHSAQIFDNQFNQIGEELLDENLGGLNGPKVFYMKHNFANGLPSLFQIKKSQELMDSLVVTPFFCKTTGFKLHNYISRKSNTILDREAQIQTFLESILPGKIGEYKSKKIFYVDGSVATCPMCLMLLRDKIRQKSDSLIVIYSAKGMGKINGNTSFYDSTNFFKNQLRTSFSPILLKYNGERGHFYQVNRFAMPLKMISRELGVPEKTCISIDPQSLDE